MLRQSVRDFEPWRLRPHKEVAFNLVVRRLIQATKRKAHSFRVVVVGTDEIGAADGTEVLASTIILPDCIPDNCHRDRWPCSPWPFRCWCRLVQDGPDWFEAPFSKQARPRAGSGRRRSYGIAGLKILELDSGRKACYFPVQGTILDSGSLPSAFPSRAA